MEKLFHLNENGREALADYQHLKRHIMNALQEHKMLSMYELVVVIRRKHHEYKFTKLNIFINALGELRKDNVIEYD